MSFCEQEKKQHSTTVKAVTVEASFAKFSTFAMHAREITVVAQHAVVTKCPC